MTTRTTPFPPLALVGCDFRVAPSSARATLVLSSDERRDLLERLRGACGAAGLVVLDTCNRTEWVVETKHAAWTAELLAAWMQRRFRAARRDDGPAPRPYVHLGVDAVRHFLRVAVGLESLVPGEREIAGQCARALVVARRDGTGSHLLDQLGHAAGRAVRRMERSGRFRESSRSVAGVAVDHLLARVGDPGRRPVIGVVGMGQIGRKAAGILEARGARVVLFNRTPAQDSWLPLEALTARLPDLDGLVVATGAPRAHVTLDGSAGRHRPLVVSDIGVPPQVVPTEASDIVTIDDLPLGESSADPAEVEVATATVELGVQQVVLAAERRGSARLLEAASSARAQAREHALPDLLDQHLPELEPLRRRRLEAALSSLLGEQQRALLEALQPDDDEVVPPADDASGSSQALLR